MLADSKMQLHNMKITFAVIGPLVFSLAIQDTTCQYQCQCDGNVLPKGGNQEWFYTFDQLFYDSCTDVHTCQATCYVYLKNITGDFNLNYEIDGLPLGEFACSKLTHDVVKDSSILFQSQSCATGWVDVATIPGFCCIDGHFPQTGCSSATPTNKIFLKIFNRRINTLVPNEMKQ